MCDVCSDFAQLLVKCEDRLSGDISQYPSLSQAELEIVLNYILTWPQRQCMCCYRDVKNFERFYLLVQSILCLTVCQLKLLCNDLLESASTTKESKNDSESRTSEEGPSENSKTQETKEESENNEMTPSTSTTDEWTMLQREKLIHITSKIFLLNFPLYLACKHSALSRLDDLSGQEISNLSSYCDLHDTEIPAYLLKNVSLFCKLGGVMAMTAVFENANATNLPLSMTHTLVAAVGNLKLWLNFRAVSLLFIPLRSKILKYMCSLEDKDLRVPAVKSMADFMWGSAKEPLDAPISFDADGLALAFKYFNSSTLTMRLAGIAQINAHITAHNELCTGEMPSENEIAGQQLAMWLTNNNIIEHLFGPNLHVEVIKQSHMILKFLAVEGRITPEHVELVWAAAQLKHCGRQVYDLLPGFIRALAPKPCAHLYNLLCALPPKDHTEQSLYLASALLRALWSRGGSPALHSVSPVGGPELRHAPCKPHHNSSSEASVSIDQSNSEDDPCEEISSSGDDTGPTPRKQTKHQRDIVDQEWLQDGEELSKKESLIKPCQKRSKPHVGSSGSGSSGAEELLRPRKKKLYRKRPKPNKARHFTPLKPSDLAESVSEVEEDSSGSDNPHCQLMCDNDARRLIEMRLLESYKRHERRQMSEMQQLDDDSACEEELARLAAQAQCISEYQSLTVNVDEVCAPGHTLLWDLLQDGNIVTSCRTLPRTHVTHSDEGLPMGLKLTPLNNEQLGEGLALEAEKALCALLCFSSDKFIRIKFIEGCLDNLANHRSVAVSLRLLPKLFSSFQQLRGMDMHQVVMWAERERGMMRLFLEDLRHFSTSASSKLNTPDAHYAHITQLTVRLHFLTAIFSPLGSPQHFRLTVEQVEELWQCLVVNGSSQSADCLYSWLLSHTKSPEQHALGVDALRFLYVDKMPTLDPENISIMGFSLYQQLCNLARMALGTGDSKEVATSHAAAMDHLWKIALRANSTDVSMGAIQYLNSYYMGQQLQQEDDFVSKCMFHLTSGTERLAKSQESTTVQEETSEKVDKCNIYEHMSEEAALQCIQRALLLLKTHLDTFKRRYAYHLRRSALSESGISLSSGGPLRIVLQPGGAGPRASLQMHHHDLVAHLRAHVHAWWEKLMEDEESIASLNTTGPLRIITQGQELTPDYDERTLYDMGFKDNQLVFVSVGAGGWQSPPAPPLLGRLPTQVLLLKTNFSQLFALMQTLAQMHHSNEGESVSNMKAQLLSRRVWDILQAVPLNTTILEAFQEPTESQLQELLDPTSPQKLMYSLHIVDKLSTSTKKPSKGDDDEASGDWVEAFRSNGGLKILYDIMMSGVLQRSDDSEWRQDCLALLLQLICRIGSLPTADPSHTPKLHPSLVSLMRAEETTDRLMSILSEAATPKDPMGYKTGFWGRAQVVQHCLRVCVLCGCALARPLRTVAPRLLLDDHDPNVRRECASALYRLCALGDVGVVAPLLQLLLQHLPRAADMASHHQDHHAHHHEIVHHHVEEGKEPYGPACRDYFWLVCRLVDSLPEDFFKENTPSEDPESPDLNELCVQISLNLEKRDSIESLREPVMPDDGLCGQLSLLTHLVKHPLPFKTSSQATRTLHMVFGFLFDVPTPTSRNLPKCKSQKSRAAAYDLLVEIVRGAPDNYMVLHDKLMEHHKPVCPMQWYPWDYWPMEESRSASGYVGLANLGATCYLAACMQHLFMMPKARQAVLDADADTSRHAPTLREMQRMFAYLMESERKSYNPRSFCKVYQMDHQPLNTGEQKDMAEFFIDLVSKMEEMTPRLKKLVKTLFCGVLSNNVVSLDCGHVSRTLEEFYTVRCQVADMRNLHQSLDEVTVKDTLEGDNCYTCSHCSAKVRAEKRACFKKLPRILCFNTMRYTFNMLTMLKEKVNTHFSFPMRLDMSGYVEKHLMPAQYQEEKNKTAEMKKDGDGSTSDSEDIIDTEEHYEYELIGVTVHTGTADGGHYYSFIRERTPQERWLLFNDAEVKTFDPQYIANECFGGEMTSKTYDSVTDKFMDFSFEKTNSAYMLFYEWCPPKKQKGNEPQQQEETQSTSADCLSPCLSSESRLLSESQSQINLPEDLLNWIWEDNMQFLHDKNIFQHPYFTFMGQMCSSVPQSLLTLKPEITEIAARLSTSFFIETFIHAKEKPTMVSWVELVTKQFNASQAASEWFLGHMAQDTWWPMQVLIKCPNQMVRQMYQRLCMHVIQRLRSSHCALYLQGAEDDDSKVGEASCVTRYIRMLLSLMENGARNHLRHLTEYFSLLYEFSKMGEEEGKFLLRVNAISTMVNFYLGQTSACTIESPCEEAVSSGSGSGSTDSSLNDKLRPAALDKLVALVTGLVERSRDAQGALQLTENDASALTQAKGFPFVYQQARDSLNLGQTKCLIFALCRWNEPLAQKFVNMIFSAIAKQPEGCAPFLKLLSLLAEGSGSGAPCFLALLVPRLRELVALCGASALEWLALQAPRSQAVARWALEGLQRWAPQELLAGRSARARAAAAQLLVSLVPSQHFRSSFLRSRASSRPAPPPLPEHALPALHQILNMLLQNLTMAKEYADVAHHGTMKLTAYFSVMTYCIVSRVEKLMFTPFVSDLWDLYHPLVSEPTVGVHPNKQALLCFWHAVSLDCPENIQAALKHPRLTKHIAFNYILADHEDGEVVAYNRAMLPPYYALLRMMGKRSTSFARSLLQHQNIHWAYRNIAPYAHLYPGAADELIRLARILSRCGSSNNNEDKTESSSTVEDQDVASFRRSTLSAYLQGLNGRTCWSTLISVLSTLVESEDDRMFVVYNGGLQMIFEGLSAALSSDTGVPVSALTRSARRVLRWARSASAPNARLLLTQAKDWPECARRLLNMDHAPHLYADALGVVRELALVGGGPSLVSLLPLLLEASQAQRRRNNTLPARPYHALIDTCCRVARSDHCLNEQLVLLSALCALEAVPLKFNYFARFWNEVSNSENDSKLEEMLLSCSVVSEYMDAVLIDDRESLEDDQIYRFLMNYYPKMHGSKEPSPWAALSCWLSSEEWKEGPIQHHLGHLRGCRVSLMMAEPDHVKGLKAAAEFIAQRVEQYQAPPEEVKTESTCSAPASPAESITPNSDEEPQADESSDEEIASTTIKEKVEALKKEIQELIPLLDGKQGDVA